MSKNTIFVQIASYRDPELLPTLRDMIQKAKHPENLSVGICWQHSKDDAWDNLEEFVNDSKFKIVDVDYKESKGVCWARNMVQSLYDNEKFTLQIDSHMRFIEEWDSKIIDMWENLEEEKAVLTTYPGQYYPKKEKNEWTKEPYIIHVHSMKNGQTEQRPNVPKNWESRDNPYRAVHMAAGFVFSIGKFIIDVPYDPEFYFSGEETSLSVRSFTHGYNLYHPHKVLLWHYYTRKDEAKHWTDHPDWGKLSNKANDRLNCLLGRNNNYNLGKYCLGKTRTLEDYQNYSGIDYSRNILHLDTIDAKEPPVDTSNKERWSYTKKTFKQKLKWDFSKIDKCEDPQFWAIIIKDKNASEIYRKDMVYENYRNIIDGKTSEIEIEFEHYHPFQTPDIAMIWPYSQSKQWLKNTTWKI